MYIYISIGEQQIHSEIATLCCNLVATNIKTVNEYVKKDEKYVKDIQKG